MRNENPDITFGTSHLTANPFTPSIPPNCIIILTCIGQIGKILGERWKNMTEKDKIPYESKAGKDKERYEAEKRAYNVTSPLPPIPPF